MGKRIDVLVVGELNVDLILDRMEKSPEIGKEILAQNMTLTLGSSSAIFASNISFLGSRVAFIGKIGGDSFGNLVVESLRKNGVDTSMIKVDDCLGTGATVVLNVGEDRAMVTYPGAMEYLSAEDISAEELQSARHLHFSSYYLQPGMKKGLGGLFKKAKEMGLTTSFDMQWDPDEEWDLDMEKILPYVDVFLPNEKELKYLTGKNSLDEAIGAVERFTNILAVKRGSKGSVVNSPKGRIDLPPFLNENVVDAIGAGDSYNAGFIYKYINGFDIRECQRFANLTGAISTTAAGGTAAFHDYEQFKETARKRFGVEL